MRKNKGFTLVELLVVISIIAILLAILMPSMKKAQEQARFVICKSNFKTYGLASAMYLQANNESFSHPCYALYRGNTFTGEVAPHPFQCRWHDNGVTPNGPLWPYVRDKNVSFCPTFARIVRADGQFHSDKHIASIPINSQFTYSINGFLSNGNSNPAAVGEDWLADKDAGLRMPKLTSIKRPSQVMFLTEENYWTMNHNPDRTTPWINRRVRNLDLSWYGLNDMYFMPDMYGGQVSGGRGNGDCIATFHKATDARLLTGFSSILFNDGHVGAEKAYDAKTVANTVRRSWQLATGKY